MTSTIAVSGAIPRSEEGVEKGINGHAFFMQLNYTAANEDGRSECLALNLKATDQVVCITGSGARPLDLAITGPKRIFAVDLNASQNYLLSLKIAAIQGLEYSAFAELLGLVKTSGAHRIELFQSIAGSLAPECRAYWQKNLRLIEDGVLVLGNAGVR